MDRSWARRIIDGDELTEKEGLEVLETPDADMLLLLDAASQVRRHFFGSQVKTNVLSNAKRGMCSEDCHYCGQSQQAGDQTFRHARSSPMELLRQAQAAKDAGGKRFCVTMAVRSASWSDISALAEATRQIKDTVPLEVCACLGLMTGGMGKAKLRLLKEAGVDAYNHNLNTHEELYPQICTTHTWQDRLETLHNAQEAGLSTCSGLIVGMGESDRQLVDLARTFRKEAVESIPVNFLIPIDGTELAKKHTTTDLTPWKCLRILCLFRMLNPRAEIRASAGRELHIRSLQSLALLVANSLFLDGYLTQSGQGAQKDFDMIADLGMDVSTDSISMTLPNQIKL